MIKNNYNVYLDSLKKNIFYNIKPFYKYKNLIYRYSLKYKLNPNIIFAILIIESYNRSNIIYKKLEIILCKYLPHIAVNYDISIGITQIKISTAKKIYKELNKVEIAKKLINDEYNIKTCALLIKEILTNYNNKIELIPKIYLTGNKDCKTNTVIQTYTDIFTCLLNKKII